MDDIQTVVHQLAKTTKEELRGLHSYVRSKEEMYMKCLFSSIATPTPTHSAEILREIRGRISSAEYKIGLLIGRLASQLDVVGDEEADHCSL